MPAGVRVQQLTPVVRASSNQPTTIVRLMSPATTNIRPGTGQQQFIQLNTNKQHQPLVIKAITAQTSNRQQQQPILLAANTQQKPSQQQVLVFNQNSTGQQPKFTLQMTNNDHNQQEPTTDNRIPQLDGSVDDQIILNGTSKQQQTLANHETSQTTLNGNEQQPIDDWHLVGTFKTTTADIKHYYVVPSKINIDNYVCFNIFLYLFDFVIYFRISIHFKYII
jgi:hypothetical protein